MRMMRARGNEMTNVRRRYQPRFVLFVGLSKIMLGGT